MSKSYSAQYADFDVGFTTKSPRVLFAEADAELDRLRAEAALLKAKEPRECGWVCADGFPALKGHLPLKPGARLFAMPDAWHDAALTPSPAA